MGNRMNCWTRRSFLAGLSAAGIMGGISREGRALPVAKRRTLAYVGTDTVPVDGPANGKGIYRFEVNTESGELKLLAPVTETPSASWLTLHPSGKYLYAVNELSNYEGNSGSVSAFEIERGTGTLRFLNTVNSRGAGPTHMSIDGTGRFAFVANYFGGTVAVFPIAADGRLGTASFVQQDKASLGPLQAASAPPGSFAISGHDAPHAHMIHADPQNRFVLHTDLGQDRIYVWKFDAETGKLTAAATPFVSVPRGDGPRHFAFHPNGRWFYSIQEEASTLELFDYDGKTGALTHQQTVSALPEGFAGTNYCSEVVIAASGRFLYAANRLHDSIATFAIGDQGRLRHVGDTATQGDYPNHIAIEPGGRFMYACNQRSDTITMFRVDKITGRLVFTGKYQPLGTPMCMVFLHI